MLIVIKYLISKFCKIFIKIRQKSDFCFIDYFLSFSYLYNYLDFFFPQGTVFLYHRTKIKKLESKFKCFSNTQQLVAGLPNTALCYKFWIDKDSFTAYCNLMLFLKGNVNFWDFSSLRKCINYEQIITIEGEVLCFFLLLFIEVNVSNDECIKAN